MCKLLLLGTGGTIACMPTEEGLAPTMTAMRLLDFIDADKSMIHCRDLFAMDSSNIQPEEWLVMASEVYGAAAQYDGIIITHGTDTLAYTASMLSFMLQGIPIPVVLTGAQYPIIYPDSDGRRNLYESLIAARGLPGGVYVCFNGAVMLGCRAVKVRTTSLAAFESVNAPYVGTVANDAFFMLTEGGPQKKGFLLNDTIEPAVALIKLAPGTSPALFHALPGCGYRGLVVEAFGLGGVHSIRRDHTDALIKLMGDGTPVVLCSQCLYEQSTPSVYQVSSGISNAGVIPAGDMTTEAAVTKLMWVLGQTRDMNEIRSLMQENLCGERSL